MKFERLLKIPCRMTADDHRSAAEQISRESLHGLDISSFGGAFGPAWDPESECDLDFLRHYPSIRVLRLGVRLSNLDPLDAVSETLTALSLMDPPGKPSSIDLAPVARCRVLQSFENGWRGVDLEPLTAVQSLISISLTGGSQERVAVASELRALQRLNLGFGTLRDTAALSSLRNLQIFSALRVKQLRDLSFLSLLPGLRLVELDGLAQVDALPDLSSNRSLQTVLCSTMNGLSDLDGLIRSTVNELAVINSKVPPKAFERIAGQMPLLEWVVVHLGRKRDTSAALALFDPKVHAESTNAFSRYHADGVHTQYTPFGEHAV